MLVGKAVIGVVPTGKIFIPSSEFTNERSPELTLTKTATPRCGIFQASHGQVNSWRGLYCMGESWICLFIGGANEAIGGPKSDNRRLLSNRPR